MKTKNQTKNQPIKIQNLILILLIGLCLANLYTTLFPTENQNGAGVSDYLFLLLNFVTVLLLWWTVAATRKITGTYSRGWIFISLAQTCYFIGDILSVYQKMVLQDVSFPSTSDLFYYIYYPLFLAGIFLFTDKNESGIRQVDNWLNAFIIFISSGMVLGIFLISPLLESLHGEPAGTIIPFLLYPICDLFLISCLLVFVYSRIDNNLRSSISYLTLYLCIMLAADLYSGFQSIAESSSGTIWTNSAWAIGYSLLGYSSFRYLQIVQKKARQRQTTSADQQIEIKNPLITSLRDIFPYAYVVIALILLFTNSVNLDYRYSSIFFYWVGLISLLVLIRQFINTLETRRLNANLSKTVIKTKSQATSLKKINENLRVEIGERKKAESQLAYNAMHDSLTHLPNRVLFIDRLRHAIDFAKRNPDYTFSVLFIDVDNFKDVNDILGHYIGDELLKMFTSRMRVSLRKSDTLARLGGDEFGVILEDHNMSKKTPFITKRILENLQPPYLLAGINCYLSASIGVVLNTKKYENPDDILKDADLAMYKAKSSGKARYVNFTPDLRKNALFALELESQLREAVQNNQFILHYQPIFHLADSTIHGFEALLRWNHPKLGLMMPREFLSIAERSDIIEDISEWVIWEALRQLKAWSHEIPGCQNLAMNINLSARLFKKANFIEILSKAINEKQFKPGQINLEITETMLIENLSHSRNIFNKFKDMGIRIQIDDFGIGYSSFGYLHQYPADTIKIDKSFIHSIGREKKGDPMVQTMITLANKMGLDVVAEGIETRKQLAALKTMGCQYGQGYYLSVPLPAEEARNFILTHESYARFRRSNQTIEGKVLQTIN